LAAKKRVVVVGAAGYIASQLVPQFREQYDLVTVDITDTTRSGDVVPDIHIADLLNADLEEHRALFAGADAIVHCGFRGSASAGYGDDGKFDAEMDNVRMARNVFELAQMEGVRRVVVASSNHAADWYEPLLHSGGMDVVSPETFPLSDNLYGWAKAVYEHLGFVYATGKLGSKLEVVMVRIGAPRPIVLERFIDSDPSRYRRDLGAWISPRDMRQLFAKSIDTPDIDNEHGIPFQIFYGVSGNARGFWSIVNARAAIGYAPEDDSEREYADDIASFLHAD
jgi:hypothetical protein